MTDRPTIAETSVPPAGKPQPKGWRRALWPYLFVLVLGAGLAVYGLISQPEIAAQIGINSGSQATGEGLDTKIAALIERTEALAGLEARVAALEAAGSTDAPVGDKPAATEGDELTAVEARIAALEAHQGSTLAINPGAEMRLAALEREMARLGQMEHDLQRLAPLERDLQRLAPLERVQAQRNAALSALVLARAMDSGSGFSVEYDLARQAMAPALAERISVLGTYANGGILRLDQLAARFEPMVRALESDTAQIDPNLSWPARVVEYLRGLVILRPVDAQPGTDLTAILSRARAAMAEGNFEKAAAEIAQASAGRPSPATMQAAQWAGMVTARLSADRTMTSVAALLAAKEPGPDAGDSAK